MEKKARTTSETPPETGHSQPGASSRSKSDREERQARLEAELRANLQRRKAQTRARSTVKGDLAQSAKCEDPQ